MRRLRWYHWIALAAAAALILTPQIISRRLFWDAPRQFDGASTNLQQTVILPTLDTPIPEGKSALWCLSFQLAWHELTGIVKEPIQLAGTGESVERLNQAKGSADDLTPGTCYAAAGSAADRIVHRIQGDMNRQFPGVYSQDFGAGDVIVAFAYLQASLRFPLPYFDTTLTFTDAQGNEARIGGFGIRHNEQYGMRELRQQVEVLFAKQEHPGDDQREFAVDLCKTSDPEQIVLALVDQKETLAKTLQYVESKIKSDKYKPGFGISDELLVPALDWKIEHRFAELEGRDKAFLNPSMKGMHIDRAFQLIQFKLDKGGAELSSKAGIAVKSDAGPARYHFNRPFLLYMKRRDCDRPYLVMWIDNAELLSK